MAAIRMIAGADHGGYALKNQTIESLRIDGSKIVDCGVNSGDPVDYPDIASEVCRRLIDENFDFALLFCGTGIGVSIAANKIPGVRCAVIHDLYTAEKARTHNNANALAFGGRVDYHTPVVEMIKHFLKFEFAAGRHTTRIEKLGALDIDQ